MENSYSRLSKSQSFSRHASNHDIKSSLKDIQNEYAKALEQIEDLKSERSYLKATLNRSTDEKQNRSVKEESISVNQVSQTLKNSYANKALIESERRVLELEEENKQLKKLVKSHGKKFLKMQEEILSYQYEVDKLGYLKVYNQDLKAEMELLDQEFQAIIKRVEVLDEEKSQSQVNQSLSIKNTKEFKQVILKYSNYIIRSVNSLDSKNPIRFRFEETFPSDSDLLNLVVNRDYSTLILKAMKLIADFMPNTSDNMEQEESLHRFSPFSVGEVTPQKISVFNTLSDQMWSQVPEPSLQSSQLLPTSLTKGLHSSQIKEVNSSQIRSQIKLTSNSQPSQLGNESNKKHRETQSSLSFGTRESKPQSIDMKAAAETPRSVRSQHDAIQKLDVSPIERPTHNFPEIRLNTGNSAGSPYIREEFDPKTAAELELIQREKELIERERELMEKKKEYIMKSRELGERDYSLSEQRSMRENTKSANDTPVEHGRIKSQKRIQSEADDSTLRIREEDEYEHRRSPLQLKSILKSSSSQIMENLDKGKDSIVQRRKEDETLSIGSAGNNIRSAKDMSNVLREKSKHIAKVLTKGSIYEDDLQSVTKSEHEISINRSRDKSPVNSSCRNFEEEDVEALKASKIKSSEKIFHEDLESRFVSNDNSLVADKKSWFYPKGLQNQSLNNQSKNNSNMQSYHPLSLEPNRKESNESRRDESSNKKVSFYGRYPKSLGSENQDSVTSQDRSQAAQSPEQDGQQNYGFPTSRRFNDVPRGTQYASFSVAFGRTESAERDPCSPLKNLGSIIDVYMKKRVDHVHQTYDVVKGEELYKKAVREHGSPQYKVVAEAPSSNRREKRRFFNSEDYVSPNGKPAN